MQLFTLRQSHFEERSLLTKTVRVMKITAFLLLVVCLQLSARGLGQGKITLIAKAASLESILKDIRKQTGYQYLFVDQWEQEAKKIDISVKNASLEEVLGICFKDQPFSYTIIKKMIVIKKKVEDKAVSENLLAPLNFKGRVTNEQGEPLAGASVTVKNGKKGTLTDEKGMFELKNVPADAVLMVSYTGYQNKEISINGEVSLTIILGIAKSILDQVQVIAYGTTTQRLSTGNVSTVKSEDIVEQPISNPLAALEGRVPGLFITQNTGTPGGSFFVQIRGQGSIASGNLPLYIVDGIPLTPTSITSTAIDGGITNGGSPLNSINPADIQSIDILKDADATAIYGARGANGVILITTKKGKPGKMTMNLNVYSGFGSVTREMKMLNTKQYLAMRREAFKNDGVIPDVDNAYDLLIWDTTRYTNWQKELTGGTANITDIQSSLSGGDVNTQHYISAGYHHETTVFPGNFADNKGAFGFNLNHSSTNHRFKLLLSANYVLDKNNLLTNDLASITAPVPDAPKAFDNNGNLYWTTGFTNPYSSLLQKFIGLSNIVIGHSEISYNIAHGLQLKASLGGTQMWTSEVSTNPKNATNPAYDPISSANFGNSHLSTWIIEPQVEYRPAIKFGNLSVLAGATIQENKTDRTILNASGFSNDSQLEYVGAASTITVNNLFSGNTQYRYQAVFGRISYDFDRKYLLNLTARRDGSSRFGPDRQFANFGAAGVGWIFSEEKWFSVSHKTLSFGKFRASYGTTGNDQIGDYQYFDTWSPNNYPYQNQAGFYPTRLFNPNYGWEINTKMEFGIELGFFNDRLLLNSSYYRNRSSNQLVGYPLPGITGFTSIQGNLPALVQNTGLEIAFNSVNINTQHFSWTSSFNITIPRNKLIAYPGLAESSYANTYVVGKPLSISESLHFTSVNPQTGVMQFQDVNKNGSDLDIPGDLLPIKKVAQDFYGGMQNNLSFKEWSLSFTFQFVKQTGYNYIPNYLPPGLPFNQPTYVLSRWQKPGDITNIQLFTQGGNIDAFLASLYSTGYGDNRISDASFIRLKNLFLSYSLSESICKKWHVQKISLYIKGQNLLTFTHYMGKDPENNGSNLLPPLKVLTAGLQFNF